MLAIAVPINPRLEEEMGDGCQRDRKPRKLLGGQPPAAGSGDSAGELRFLINIGAYGATPQR